MTSKQFSAGDGPPLACKLTDPEFAARKAAISRDLFADVAEVRELADGFAYRWPATDERIATVTDFIIAERECCPFFTFEVAIEPDGGPLWLRLRGSEEIKAFIAAELDGSLRPAAAF
jgi:hypothetical protein